MIRQIKFNTRVGWISAFENDGKILKKSKNKLLEFEKA